MNVESNERVNYILCECKILLPYLQRISYATSLSGVLATLLTTLDIIIPKVNGILLPFFEPQKLLKARRQTYHS